jgi:hypothetical protein
MLSIGVTDCKSSIGRVERPGDKDANAFEQRDAVAYKQYCDGDGDAFHERKEKGGAKYKRRIVTAVCNKASSPSVGFHFNLSLLHQTS